MLLNSIDMIMMMTHNTNRIAMPQMDTQITIKNTPLTIIKIEEIIKGRILDNR